MKLTLLTYVRSEEDDPLGPTPSDIYTLYYQLRGFLSWFLVLGRIIIKVWDLSPTQKLKFLLPHSFNLQKILFRFNLNIRDMLSI